MMNLPRCKTCCKILTSEEAQKHSMCYIDQTKSKRIYASHISTLKNDDDEFCALVTGLDDITYTVIEKKPDFVEYIPKLDSDLPKSNTEKNYRRGTSTFIRVRFSKQWN